MAKKTIKAVSTTGKVPAYEETLPYAINRLAYFKQKRGEAKTPEELVELSLWTEHWTKVVADLKSK